MSSRSATDTRSREAKLDLIRRQNALEARNRRIVTLVTTGIVVVLVALVGVVIWRAAQEEATLSGSDPANLTAVPYVGPDGTGGEGSGFAVGPEDAPATVTLYEDYLCPACRAFEEQYGEYIDQLPDQGVRVVYHPVAILDRLSQGTAYSSRAASAAACVAQGDDADLTAFKAYSDALFANQPAEGGPGLESTRLADLAVEAGAPDEVRSCIEADTFVGWAERSTAEATLAGLTGTPFVAVNGEAVESTQEAIQAAIDAA